MTKIVFLGGPRCGGEHELDGPAPVAPENVLVLGESPSAPAYTWDGSTLSRGGLPLFEFAGSREFYLGRS